MHNIVDTTGLLIDGQPNKKTISDKKIGDSPQWQKKNPSLFYQPTLN